MRGKMVDPNTLGYKKKSQFWASSIYDEAFIFHVSTNTSGVQEIRGKVPWKLCSTLYR